MTRRLFISGLGFSGLEIAKLARAGGWTVAGTCTTEEKARKLREAGIEPTGSMALSRFRPRLSASPTHVFCTIAPGESGDPALRTCRPLLGSVHWLGYLPAFRAIVEPQIAELHRKGKGARPDAYELTGALSDALKAAG